MQHEGNGVGDILVVDDNPADHRFIEEAFQESTLDPTIHSTTTLNDALEFLSRCRHEDGLPSPVLILLDWNLSRSTGEEVLEAAKSGDRNIPVIVMTGSQPETTALEPTPESADLVIEKPTDPDEYVEHIHSLLDA